MKDKFVSSYDEVTQSCVRCNRTFSIAILLQGGGYCFLCLSTRTKISPQLVIYNSREYYIYSSDFPLSITQFPHFIDFYNRYKISINSVTQEDINLWLDTVNLLEIS
jgi:hypothetical protein